MSGCGGPDAAGQSVSESGEDGRRGDAASLAANSVAGDDAGTSTRRTLPPALRSNLWQPGQSGNPTGKQGRVTAMRQLAASKTVEAMQALIDIMSDPTEDGRVRVVAAQAVLDRGAGKVTELPPQQAPAMTLDLARLSPEQLAALRVMLDSGAFVPAADPDAPDPPTIEGTAG